MYIERHCLPSTTYGAADVVKEKIKAAKGIKSIIFGARDAVANRYATSIVLIADEGSYLFDTTTITMERSPRELEVLGIFDVIKSVGALDKAVFIPAGPDYTLLNWLTNLSSRTNFIRLWMIYINQ